MNRGEQCRTSSLPSPFVIDAVTHADNFLESNMVTISDSMEEFSYGVFKHTTRCFPPADEHWQHQPGESSTIGLQKTSPIRVRREPGGHGRLPQVPMYEFCKDARSALTTGRAMREKHLSGCWCTAP
jgi:hypothetical protein